MDGLSENETAIVSEYIIPLQRFFSAEGFFSKFFQHFIHGADGQAHDGEVVSFNLFHQDAPLALNAAGDTPMESIAYSATYMNTLLGR